MSAVARRLACLLSPVLLACGTTPPTGIVVDSEALRIFRFTVANANVFVVEQNGVRLMIDSGNPGDEAEYEALMRERGIDPASIDTLLLTHGHIDHAGTAAWFQETHGVRVIGGRGDAEMIANAGRAEVCPTSLLARLIRWSRSGLSYPVFDLDRAIDGALDLASIGMEGVVLPWPGHTPGSVVAIIGEHAFVGDLLRGGIFDPQVPTTHFFMCDLEENRLRIRQLLEREGVAHWHPGHFGPLEVEAVRRYLED